MTTATQLFNPLTQPGEHGLRLGMQFLGAKVPWERNMAEGWHKGAFVRSLDDLFVAIVGKSFNWPGVWSNGSAPADIDNGSIWVSFGAKGRKRHDLEFLPSAMHGLNAVHAANHIYEFAERVIGAGLSETPRQALPEIGISWHGAKMTLRDDAHSAAQADRNLNATTGNTPLPRVCVAAILDQALKAYTAEHAGDPGLAAHYPAAPPLAVFPSWMR
jgi:hypothetical protein